MIFVGLYATIATACVLTKNGRNIMPRKLACFCIFMYMQILLGLRHIQYGGVDTQVYARDFMRIVNEGYSIVDIFQYFFKDIGFYVFAKIFTFFSTNMNAWLFFCALPFTLGVTWLIYRYSKNMFVSFVMFISYGFYLYNFQLVRHVFALGFIILAFKFLNEGNYRKYVITIIFSSLFHSIAIVFLIAYFIRKGRISWKQFAWIFLGAGATLLLTIDAVIIRLFDVVPFLSSQRFLHYATRGGGLSSDFYVQLLSVLLCWYYLYRKKYEILESFSNVRAQKEKKKWMTLHIRRGRFIPTEINLRLVFNMSVLAAIFYFMTIVIGESYRMAQFFSIFTIILVPNILKYADKRLRLAALTIIIASGLWHFFGGLYVDGSVYNPYMFFWESTQHLY